MSKLSSDPRAKTARKKFGNGIPPVYRIGLELAKDAISKQKPHELYSVLDYGCGYARFADEFIKAGAYYVASDLERKDFSDQPLFEEELQKGDAMADYVPAEHLHLCQGYKLVLLSNVVNVQSSAEQLSALIKEAWRLIDKGGSVLLNYPKSPRKLPLSFQQLKHFIRETLDRKVAIIEDYEKDLVLRLYK